MTKKIIGIIIVLILLMNSTVFAMQISDPTKNPDTYKPTVSSENSTVTQMGNVIVTIIQYIGIIISVIMLMVIGIKYMLGSLSEKAQYKEMMVPYIVGAILVFTSSTIVNIVYKLFFDLN